VLRAARQGDFSVRLAFDGEEPNGSASRNGKNGHGKNGKNGHVIRLGDGVDPEVMRAIAVEFNAMVALNEALHQN